MESEPGGCSPQRRKKASRWAGVHDGCDDQRQNDKRKPNSQRDRRWWLQQALGYARYEPCHSGDDAGRDHGAQDPAVDRVRTQGGQSRDDQRSTQR